MTASSSAESTPGIAPGTEAPPPERFPALDLLRGFALCGILLMNVMTFAWPDAAYVSAALPYYAPDSIGPVADPKEEAKAIAREEKGMPRLERERRRRARLREPRPAWPLGEIRVCAVSGPADLCEFVLADLLVDNKMRTLFSMLFGAGVLLAAARPGTGRVGPGWLHYRRMAWLLLFGALHGWLLWTGDILFAYASVGLWLWPLRNCATRRLFTIAAVLFVIPLLLAAAAPAIIDRIDARGRAVEARLEALLAEADAHAPPAPADGAVGEPESPGESPPEETDAEGTAPKEAAAPSSGPADPLGWIDARLLDAHRGIATMRRRGARPELVTRTIREHREQGYLAGVAERFRSLIGPQAGLLALGFLALGWPMVLGMALAKTGFLTGRLDAATYGRLAGWLYLAGLPLTWLALMLSLRGGISIPTTLRVVLPLELVGSLLLSLAHAAALLWGWKTGRLGRLAEWLEAAGKMALTNYLAQSLLCTILFSGWGLGLYGSVPRAGLAAIVACIWVVQLAWSGWWLARYRLGPMEWAWRSLTSFARLPLARPSLPT